MSRMAKKKTHTFGEAVRAIRAELKLTQNELAERVRENADAPWISRVESDQKAISLNTAIQIAKALGVELRLGDHILTVPTKEDG